MKGLSKVSNVTVLVTLLIAGGSVFAFGTPAHAQDYGYSYYEPVADYGYSYYEPTDYGYSYYEPADYDYSYYEPANYGYSYYEPADYGYSYYEPSDYGYSYYEPTNYGYSYYDYYSEPYYNYDGSYGYAPSYYSNGYYSAPSYYPSYSSGVTFTPTTIGRPITIGGPNTTTVTQNTTTVPGWSQTTITRNECVNNSCNVNISNSGNTTIIKKITDEWQTVQYVYPPSCSIFASPNSIASGANATLSWTSEYATSAYLTNVGGSVGISGTLSINPSQTTTYTLTVYNNSGRAGNCQTTVYVNQPPVAQYYPSCTLSAVPNYIQNGAYSTLSWTSQNATSAWLSDGLGSAALNGSMSVRPEANRIYTLTVFDSQGRTNTCRASVNVSGSYISLTQIPYTGFDFGPFGNTLYWLALVMLAGGAAYLVLFYRGGVVNVARETAFMLVTSRGAHVKRAAEGDKEANVESPSFTTDYSQVHVADLPVRQSEAVRATKDTMSVISSRGGETPRVVISRE